MAVGLYIDNFAESINRGQTYLTSDVVSGVNTLPIRNSNGITTGLFAVLSHPTSESVETCRITGVSSNSITVTTTTQKHYANDTVLILNTDQIRVYRAANVDGNAPADSSFALIGTVPMQFDGANTEFIDGAISSADVHNYWWKYTYYNSFNGAETDIADAIAVRGTTFGNGDYARISDIRKEAGLGNNRFITDRDIFKHLQRSQALIDSSLQGIYTVPFTDPINPTIEYIATQLTIGMLFKQPTSNAGYNKIGTAKYDEAMNIIKSLTERVNDLVDSNGNSLVINNDANQAFTMWPNSTTSTATADSGGGERLFRIMDRY